MHLLHKKKKKNCLGKKKNLIVESPFIQKCRSVLKRLNLSLNASAGAAGNALKNTNSTKSVINVLWS